MSQRRSTLGGWVATKSIVNSMSSGGNSVSGLTGLGKAIVSGAMTANVLTNLLTLNGRFDMPVLALYAADATARTLRLQVIVDGTTVFDATSNSLAAAGSGLAAASPPTSTNPFLGGPIRCNSSIVVNAATSLTETGKVVAIYQSNGY